MGSWAILRLGASVVVALVLSAAPYAADYNYDNGYRDGDHGYGGNGERGSSWELNTSLTFYRYFEPFPRVKSARACRDRCVYDRRCTGWTYYDADFRYAGAQSYKLQRVCVLGAGIKDRQSGNRPGRTSGEVHWNRADD